MNKKSKNSITKKNNKLDEKNLYNCNFNSLKFFKFIIINIISLYLIFSRFYRSNKIKVALCTMGRLENLYVKEFVLYYKKLGIDKIFIYDDNELNTERIKDANPLKHYAKVFDNMKNIIKTQDDAYTDCYTRYKNKYDWFLMIDMDEFLVIVNDTLKKYLSYEIFNKCDFIKFNWLIPSDNNLIYYDNRSLFERFNSSYIGSSSVKSIIRGKINNLKYHVHAPRYSPERNVSCNNMGKRINSSNVDIQRVRPINTKKAYIVHFQFKSTEELINKYKRGYRNWLKKKSQIHLDGKIISYLNMNNITQEKINYIEKELHFNFSKYNISINKFINKKKKIY